MQSIAPYFANIWWSSLPFDEQPPLSNNGLCLAAEFCLALVPTTVLEMFKIRKSFISPKTVKHLSELAV